MNEIELLKRVLYYSATIHQPHAIKTYLATKNIYALLKNPDIWTQADQLIQKSEIYNEQLFVRNIEAPEFSQQHIEGILKKGIYPVAYSALWQWYCKKGFQDIFNYYLVKATFNNEYLSHNITILLSFFELYSDLDEDQVYPFLDRVTEFLTSTFGYDFSLPSVSNNYEAISNEALLQVCLVQPSFFGHNLITLVWLMRFETDISTELLNQFRFNLYIQATTPLEDADDEINQALFQLCSEGDESQFLEAINQLVFGVTKNLHQITMADALLYLQQQFIAYTPQFKRIAEYQFRSLMA